MKNLAIILSLFLVSCQNNKKTIINDTQTKSVLVGYTPDTLFEVYKLEFSDKYGTSNGFTFYFKKIDKENIPQKGNNK